MALKRNMLRRNETIARHMIGDTSYETALKLINRERVRQEGKLPSKKTSQFDVAPLGRSKSSPVILPTAGETIRRGISFDIAAATPVRASDLPQGATSALSYGVQFISPLNDAYVTDPGRGLDPLSGVSYEVNSDNELFYLDSMAVFGNTTETGYISFLFEGLDSGDDDSRKKYYIFDSTQFKLYYEDRDADGDPVRLLHFIPDAISGNKIVTLTVPIGDGGWFGKGKHEIFLSWDFSSQTFELWFDDIRATYSVNGGDADKPLFIPFAKLAVTNSDRNDGDNPNAGEQSMYGLIDEIKFVGDFPPLRITTSINGMVSNTLYPIHHGETSTLCAVASATPINLGTTEYPFDNLVVKTATVLCALTSPGAAAADEKVKVSVDDTTADYLWNKLAPGLAIGLVETDPGLNETITVNCVGFPGPATVDHSIARWHGAGGDTLQESGVTISDTDDLDIPGSVQIDGSVQVDLSATITGDLTVTDIGCVDIGCADIVATGSITHAGPLCRAYLSGDQLNLTNNTWTLIGLDAETYDVGGRFDTSTYRFTPDVAGYYRVTVCGQFKATLGDQKAIYAGIFKNNVLYSQKLRNTSVANKGTTVEHSDTVVCNGSTDYITMKMKHINGDNLPDIRGGTEYTYMTVEKVA